MSTSYVVVVAKQEEEERVVDEEGPRMTPKRARLPSGSFVLTSAWLLSRDSIHSWRATR